MSRRRAATPRVSLSVVLACALATFAAVDAGSHAGETKPMHNDHPHRRDLTLDEVRSGATPKRDSGGDSRVAAVTTRATDHDVVVRPERTTPTEHDTESTPATDETPDAEETPAADETPALEATPTADETPTAEVNTSLAKGNEEDVKRDSNIQSGSDSERISVSSARANATTTTTTTTPPTPTTPTPPPPLRKTTSLFTWGIGGDRVGRPSDSSATPPKSIEGIPENASVTWAAASGHTALVLDTGRVYTAGRNDSAGGGGHGSPPVADAGQLGRGGATDAFRPVRVRRDPPEPESSARSGDRSGDDDEVFATQVACGRYHTVVLDESGDVYTFGLNDRGQLGRAGVFGDPDAERACGCDSGGKCACAEGADADADDRDDESRSESNVFGFGSSERLSKKKTSSKKKKKGDSCFGGWACRDGIARRVDLGIDPDSKKPRKASFVAAGRYSTAVIDVAGNAYVWGLNACGWARGFTEGKGIGEKKDKGEAFDPAGALRVFLDDPEYASTPRLVEWTNATNATNADWDPIEILAVGYVHVVFVSRSLGRVFTCDTGFDGYAGGLGAPYVPDAFGQLGRSVLGSNPDEGEGSFFSVLSALTPGEVLFPSRADADPQRIAAVDAGRCHAAAAAADGAAYAFGCGTLGGATRGAPRRIDLGNGTGAPGSFPANPFVVDVAAGEYFTLLSTSDGDLVGFGDGASGQLGVDRDRLQTERPDDLSPFWFESFGATRASGSKPDLEREFVLVPVAGYQHAAAIVERK